VGVGSCFTLILPYDPAALAADRGETRRTAGEALSGLRV